MIWAIRKMCITSLFLFLFLMRAQNPGHPWPGRLHRICLTLSQSGIWLAARPQPTGCTPSSSMAAYDQTGNGNNAT